MLQEKQVESKPKILIVDDSEESRGVVKSSLQGLGSFIEASDLKEARIATNGRDYDLILLDLFLPDGDGIEFYAELKENEKASSNSVIFISVADEIERKVEGFMLGGSDYIVKPFNPDELRARVKAHLDRHKLLKEPQKVVQLGNLKLNLTSGKASLQTTLEERELALSRSEFKLLEWFAVHSGRILFNDELVAKLNTYAKIPTTYASLRDTVESLSNKLLDCSYKIESVFDIGYRIISRYHLSS